MDKYKLWTNVQNHPAATAFMSALKLKNHRWKWATNSAEATLWCVCADQADLTRVESYYDILSKKPPVAFLASEFSPMPYATWTYFRTPLNISVLHQWVESKHLGAPTAQDIATDAPWYNQSFKLTYWPNVSSYAGSGSEVMMACSRLLHGWCYYHELSEFGVDKSLLDMMLADAASDGNLVYNPEQATERVEQSQKTRRPSMGTLGNLFRRIAHKFA